MTHTASDFSVPRCRDCSAPLSATTFRIYRSMWKRRGREGGVPVLCTACVWKAIMAIEPAEGGPD